MWQINMATLCLFLGLLPQVYSSVPSSFSLPPLSERDVAPFWPSLRRDLDIRLVKRQSGSPCGVTNGGVSCGPGQCCSADGFCGTGGDFCTAPACQIAYGPGCDGNKTPPGASTGSDPRPVMGNVPFGVEIKSCTSPGKIALTFDDGPYLYTAQLLDTLAQAGAKVTFFVTGINNGKGEIDDVATGYPAVIQRMIKEGHQVASHTWSHQDLTNLTKQQRYDQLVKNEIALTKILGFFPTYMRPPYTSLNGDVLADLKALGYHVINMDLDTSDWKGDYVAAKANFINPVAAGNKVSSSFLVLMHDIHQQTVTDLVPYILNQVARLGYQIVTVGECLGDPAANWYRDPVKGTGIPDSAALVNINVAKATASAATVVRPTASVSAGAVIAQSSGLSNATLNITSPMPAANSSMVSSTTRTGDAAAIGSSRGIASLLSIVAFLMSLL